ncbi:hypothetical protein QP519_11230 [Weeksella virosa]|uniref:Uncharacterized protein n=1 Tax=Weeksella virosa (strain ATCC 43766 / DSM 16922 / JCM 21250 / CCUG 30538 / CDC 9751 / IAM 14551 / NBRC 16016 / NCTC 11634 / CL345/78) TaxID=865938 RepID=F0NXT9_WEEVC|nr:hypothetical protein [Weeksella virosa]ADX66996.1 hypothetical protein Weevi_0274 [Weeksella virosa DSM 16922]MDK7376104.1 hypothetical protein [Weeksella virosa]VEH63274.1 Uncharacterised protein [Weeksella virosa]
MTRKKNNYSEFTAKSPDREIKTCQSIKIELKDNRWMVNNKQLHDCSNRERDFMNQFFKEVKSKEWIE